MKILFFRVTGERLLMAAAAVCFLLAAFSWYIRRAPQGGSGEIRNVLLISIDTCRADHLGCYGYQQPTTPNIDAIAAEGILYENAIAPVPLTLPSHSSMLTGTIPVYHGVHDNYDYQLDQSNLTLPEILGQKGFTTGAIVSAIVLGAQSGLNQGFTSYDDRMSEQQGLIPFHERKGDATTVVAADWIEQHQKEPFFLFLHYFDPHQAYDPPQPFAARFEGNPYAAEIAFTDHCIGQVVQKLKSLGLYDSTLIIVTADHGEMLGEHGESTHSLFIYQSAIKVPLIFKLPGRNQARRHKQLVGIVDIVPTVCQLLGIETPGGVRGKDLSASFYTTPDAAASERVIYCESMYGTKYGGNSLLGVVTDRWKFIQTTRPELYDLAADPGEARNLVESEPDQAVELQQHLKTILDEQRRFLAANKSQTDDVMRRRLESLGYVSGGVEEQFDFDSDKDDPKDLLKFHVTSVEVTYLIFQKKFSEAARLCEKLLAERPNYWYGYLQIARLLMDQGNGPAAIPYLKKVLELHPGHADANFRLGMVLSAQGSEEEAIHYLRQALESSPDDVKTHFSLGTILGKQDQLDDAIGHFQHALRVDPARADVHYNLGYALRLKGRSEEAVVHFRRALEIKPDYIEAHFQLGTVLGEQGELDQAATHFRRAIEINPKHAPAHNNLGAALIKLGRLDEAIAAFSEAVRLDPNFTEAQKNLTSAQGRK